MKFVILSTLLTLAHTFTPTSTFLSPSLTSTSLSSATSSSAPPASEAYNPDNSDFDFDPTSGNGPALYRNNKSSLWVPQRARPRRNRKSAAMRAMVRENVVTPADFIYPLFVHEEGPDDVPIPSMPGCVRHTMDSLLKEIEESVALGVNSFVLFPKVPEGVKNNLGTEAYSPDNLNNRAVRAIKARFPSVTVCTDVALDPYSNQGHDGIVHESKVLNDETINQLCKQAVSQARA
ncbi:hypothetical protein TrRE_jg2224, partial [Triparma retinervis]